MILDGVMVILATICLTVFHPGTGVGRRWNEAKFRFRMSKKDKADAEAAQVSSNGSEKVGTDTSAERL